MANNKIILNNYRAVNKADININGVTVIAGENGSGKSTTTRWVYYLLEIISNFEKYAFLEYKAKMLPVIEKLDVVRREVGFYSSISNMPNINRLRSRFTNMQDDNPDSIAAFVLQYEEVVTKLADILKEYFENPKDFQRKQRLLSYLKMPEGDKFNRDSYLSMMLSIVNNHLDDYYAECVNRYNVQMWSMLHKYFDDKLELPKSIRFLEDDVEIIGNKQFGHTFDITRCIYVDTPMALARMQDTDNVFWQQLRVMMFKKYQGDLSLGAKKMIARIKQIIHGSVIVDQDSVDDDELRFIREDGALNIPIEETATGLKTFAYILKLLENGLLDKHTLLIIDEPEAHLHPQWIVELANLLIGLYKEVGVRVLVASHNPDFISAINSISENQGIDDNVNFYIAEKDSKNQYVYNYRELGTNIGPIFESFNIALSRIEMYGGITASI